MSNTRKCKRCGKEFKPSPQRMFCSPACYNTYAGNSSYLEFWESKRHRDMVAFALRTLSKLQAKLGRAPQDDEYYACMGIRAHSKHVRIPFLRGLKFVGRHRNVVSAKGERFLQEVA